MTKCTFCNLALFLLQLSLMPLPPQCLPHDHSEALAVTTILFLL